MQKASHAGVRKQTGRCLLRLSVAISALFFGQILAQTTSTGALSGLVLDPSGAVLPGAVVRLANHQTGATDSATSDGEGRFSFLLVPPGDYEVEAGKTGAISLIAKAAASIRVTETAHLDLHLQFATLIQNIRISAEPTMLQTDSSSLGNVVNGTAVRGLPLVTRNFAQIASLSPGVAAGVYNAGELGLGGTALSQIAESNDGIFVHGARSYDNNFQLDGISVSDVQGSAAGSGGIPTPNPDSIQEFKVADGTLRCGLWRMPAPTSAWLRKRAATLFTARYSNFFATNSLTPTTSF